MNSDDSHLDSARAIVSDASGMEPMTRWTSIVDQNRRKKVGPYEYLRDWEECFAEWNSEKLGPAPIWIPSEEIVSASNCSRWMAELGFYKFSEFHWWTIRNRDEFWRQAVEKLGIRFSQPPTEILDLTEGPARAAWFVDARLNIVDSCFQPPETETAIVVQQPGGPLRRVSYGELRRQANRVSNSLVDAGYRVGDAIAVVLPMTAMSIPIYLGIVQAGCVVVSIADSFAPPEIASRLRIANLSAGSFSPSQISTKHN